MKKERVTLYDQQQSFEFQREPLLVSDISRFLSGLAKLQEEDKTGNPKLGEGLRELVRVLRPYAKFPALELERAMQSKSDSFTDVPESFLQTKPAFSSELDSELETIGWNKVDDVLQESTTTKRQIVELGFRRFGISRSSLERLNKQDALRSVRAALDNERSLDIISREAIRTGKARAG